MIWHKQTNETDFVYPNSNYIKKSTSNNNIVNNKKNKNRNTFENYQQQ